jgi:hypothetical protein
MKGGVPSTAEWFRRHQRNLRAFRQRSLWRRSHARFERDLAVHPHLFLNPGTVRGAVLQQPWGAVVRALRGQAVWTLDTAARLVCGFGFLTTGDLTGYLSPEALDLAVSGALVGTPRSSSVGLTPVLPRQAMLIAHLAAEPPPFFTLDSGDRVVTWEALMQDLKGTLGWRPDLLTRLEAAYLRRESAGR